VNWSNYDDVLGQMRGVGLLVDGLEVGRLRRCKVDGDREKRGWYSLHEITLDGGECVIVGSFGIWRGTEWNTQKVELKRSPLSADQRAALKARIAADMKAAEARRRGEASRAAMRAQKVWELCARDGDAPYLRRKGVQAHGVRFSPSGAVVIPMLDTSARVHGLQFIHAEKRQGRDKDFWPAGLAKQGHYHWIGPTPTSVMLVAEGYATGASVFEASGWPVAVAFDAGNLIHVAQALARRYKGVQILIAADDDFKTFGNPGISKAEAAALAVGGAWFAPVFSQPAEVAARAAVAALAPLPGAPGLTQAENAAAKAAVADAIKAAGAVGGTDFNDLHVAEGLHVARAQVETKLRQLGWLTQAAPPINHAGGEGEDASAQDLKPIESVGELLERYSLVYEIADTVFDQQEHKLVPLSSMRNLCTNRMTHRSWMESPQKHIVRVSEVGFDPACTDQKVRCNLWGGWPTKPKAGDCSTLLELLFYLCSAEKDPEATYQWVLRWLAYPVQYPGTKMKTALVFHGPQGTGKNMFFEAVTAIYGEYGRIIDQAAVEDKFNDWASRKLLLIADEVVARQELFHIKNKLKGLVTGDTIRINPKNVGAYEEKNHVNMIFLSNEVMPAVLERDDRRYMVVWTPEKMDPAFYETIKIEIDHGGIEALHHHLLNVPLGDFKPWTLPPMTQAKADLIDASLGSSERFVHEWIAKTLPLPVCACRTEDLYDAFRHWCHRNGAKGPQLAIFVAEAVKRMKGKKERRRHYVGENSTGTRQSTVLFPEPETATLDLRALSDQVNNFADSLRLWRKEDGGQS
jgi:putative DNA primase/helicase